MRRSRNPGKYPDGEVAIAERAADSIDAIVQSGAETYDRFRHLPRVLPVDGVELADISVGGRRRIVARLARALRAERTRGRAGHWTYDLNRHIALAQAYQTERRLLVEKPPR